MKEKFPPRVGILTAYNEETDLQEPYCIEIASQPVFPVTMDVPMEYVSLEEMRAALDLARVEERRAAITDAIEEIIETMDNDHGAAKWDRCIDRIRKLESRAAQSVEPTESEKDG